MQQTEADVGGSPSRPHLPHVRTDSFTTSWLAVRLGTDPAGIDTRRRAGELLAVPVEGGRDYLYPAWQFDATGHPLPVVARILAAARDAGLDDAALDAFLDRRAETGGPRLWELLRAGREDFVLASLRSAA
jgi:hypothetical protein